MAFGIGQIILLSLLVIIIPKIIYYWYKFANQSSSSSIGSISGGMRMISNKLKKKCKTKK